MLRTGFFTVVYLGCEDAEVAGSVDISDGRRNPHLAGELIGLSGLGGGDPTEHIRRILGAGFYCVEVMHIYNNILPPEILTKRLFLFAAVRLLFSYLVLG